MAYWLISTYYCNLYGKWYYAVYPYCTIVNLRTTNIFLCGFCSTFTSTLGIIVRDTQMIMQALLEFYSICLLFYGYQKILELVA